MRRLAIILSLFVCAPALAGTGECAFDAPELVGPWTDGEDPACGDDCIVPEAETDQIRCEDAESGCLIEDKPLLDLRMPKPEGPRCLEPAPWCTSNTRPALAMGKTLVIPPPLPRPDVLHIRSIVSLKRPLTVPEYVGFVSQLAIPPIGPPPKLA